MIGAPQDSSDSGPTRYSHLYRLGAVLVTFFALAGVLAIWAAPASWNYDLDNWYRRDALIDAAAQPLLSGPLFTSYAIWQMGLLSALPLLVLGYIALSSIRGRMMIHMANFGCLLLLAQVLFMRFNVVVGGQLISKSERGFVEFHWEFFAKEGIFTAAALLSAPLVAYYVISRFIPIFEDPAAATKPVAKAS
jgi:hypothetical protein